MEPAPQANYIAQNSKKRVLSRISFMETPVIEVASSASGPTGTPKQKQAVLQEVIDVDEDEDHADLIILDDKVDPRGKGKAVQMKSYDYTNYQPKDGLAVTLGPVSKVDSSAISSPGSHNFDDLEFGSYGDYFVDGYHNDSMDAQYEVLQAYLDHADIPAGVEVTIPQFPDLVQSKAKTAGRRNSSHKSCQMKLDANNVDGMYSSLSSLSPNVFVKHTSASSFSLPIPLDTFSDSAGVDVNLPFSPPKTVQRQKNLGTSQSPRFLRSDAMMLPTGAESSLIGHIKATNIQKRVGSGGSSSNLSKPSFPVNISSHPFMLGSETQLSWLHEAVKSNSNPLIYNYTSTPSFSHPFSFENIYPGEEMCLPPSQDSVRIPNTVDEGDILRKFQQFKHFDTVEDHSDHHYATTNSTAKEPSKVWAKSVQDEWRILEKDLPDTIFVRVYESRMDLLRAVIVGAEGTPYHDGLFFFDVFFPVGYPYVPPLVYYHSGGLRLNPNLYGCGKVCLSLLNTWTGNKNEKWIPGRSTMLQVLVSIQALILNQKPFFNEPGYERMIGSKEGEIKSQDYNENTFILSVRTMMYAMRRPPKHFEDFVIGHFYTRAHEILVACKAYMEGAPVGCLVKGGVQDVDEGDKSCSRSFKVSVAAYVGLLVGEFTQLGVRDCDKFLDAAKKVNDQANCMLDNP